MKKILKYSAIVLSAIWLFAGCTKKFDEINTNPASYNQENFDPNFLLTTAQEAMILLMIPGVPTLFIVRH